MILVETALRRQRAARSSILEARLTQYSFRVLLVIIELSVVTIAAVPLRRILSSAVGWTLVHVLVARVLLAASSNSGVEYAVTLLSHVGTFTLMELSSWNVLFENSHVRVAKREDWMPCVFMLGKARSERTRRRSDVCFVTFRIIAKHFVHASRRHLSWLPIHP